MAVLQVTHSPFSLQPAASTQLSTVNLPTVNLRPQNLFSRLLSAFAGRRTRASARKQKRIQQAEAETRGKHEFIEGVRGKIVDRIVIVTRPDELGIEIQFQDNTCCDIQLETETRLWIENMDLMGWKDGNDRILKRLL